MKQDTLLIRIVMGLLLVVVAAYMVLSGVKTMINPHKLVVVYNDVVENSLTVNGLIFRKEQRLDPAVGLISYRLDEGEKAAAGQVAAISYQSQEALARQQKIREVSAQHAQLEYALSNEAPSGRLLESQMLSTITKLQGTSSRGDFTHLFSQADHYKRLVLRREYLYSEASASELGRASIALGQELGNLKNYMKDDAKTIYTPASGVFSSYVDGYEALLNPDLLHGITVSEYQGLVGQAPASNDGSVGKVATSSEWFFTMLVKEEELPLFQHRNGVQLRISSLVDPIPMTIHQVGYVQEGQAVVVLSAKRNLAEIIALREQTATVIFQSEAGIRIPKKALRVQEDGAVGVYTLTAYQAEFKPVKVVAENEEDYIVTPNPTSSKDQRILRSGDEVIITPRELYEGKVVR